MQSVILLSLFLPLITMATPIPATTSSRLISERAGIFYSPLGFTIDAAKTGWQQAAVPNESPYIATIYKSNDSRSGVQGALTVRVDKEKKIKDISEYAKKWMKDYPRLGFEILAAKKINVNTQEGYLLDLISRDNHMQLRQVLFMRGRNIVNLTCRDHQDHFTNTLHSCNEIIRSFRW